MRNRRSLFAVPYVVWMALFVVAPIIMVVVYALNVVGDGLRDCLDPRLKK